MKKKILIAAAIILFLGMLVSVDYLDNDPNVILKHINKKLTLDKTVEVDFKQDGAIKIGKHKIPVFVFKPDENAEYLFTVSDIKTDADVYLTMSVCDRDLNDYITIDNSADHAVSFSDSEFLSEGSKCYVIIAAVNDKGELSSSGTFSITVSKVTENTETIELTESEAVTVQMTEDEMSSVLFVPSETAYYRFDTSVASGKENSGYSYVSSVKDDKNKDVENTEGISYLEEGRSYFIWVSASDLTTEDTAVSVSCTRVAVIETEETGAYSISGPTLISFKAADDNNYVVYSKSDGNITGSVYDSNGFPLNKDDSSGGTLSGNENDFALILQAQKNEQYIIFANGEFNECSINIAVYKGDGTSLGPEDLE